MEYLVARDRLLQAMGSQFYTEAVVAFLSILATATPAYRTARGPGFGTVLASTADGEESSWSRPPLTSHSAFALRRALARSVI